MLNSAIPQEVKKDKIPIAPDSIKTGFFLPVLITILSSFPPLSTDIYLPSLPDIAKAFNAPDYMVNLTLVLFIIFFAFSTLLWGPVSDKFGRKPSLIAGVALYAAAGCGCFLAGSIHELIFWRVLQAIGGGAPVTISFAIVQDIYQGETKRKILAVLGAVSLLAPIVGPAIGSAMLIVAGWRMIFLALFLLGLLSFSACFFIPETKPDRDAISVFSAFKGLFKVLQNRFFRQALMVFSLPSVYAFAFIGGSAFIFMSEFGQSQNAFSVFFGINALFGILGSSLYVFAMKWIRVKRLAAICFLLIAVSGICIVLFGKNGPVVFLICVLPGTIAASLLRPLSLDILMDAGGSDSGAASAVINFTVFLLGSIGMQLVAMEWESRVRVYGILAIILGLFCFLIWPLVYRASKKNKD